MENLLKAGRMCIVVGSVLKLAQKQIVRIDIVAVPKKQRNKVFILRYRLDVTMVYSI